MYRNFQLHSSAPVVLAIGRIPEIRNCKKENKESDRFLQIIDFKKDRGRKTKKYGHSRNRKIAKDSQNILQRDQLLPLNLLKRIKSQRVLEEPETENGDLDKKTQFHLKKKSKRGTIWVDNWLFKIFPKKNFRSQRNICNYEKSENPFNEQIYVDHNIQNDETSRKHDKYLERRQKPLNLFEKLGEDDLQQLPKRQRSGGRRVREAGSAAGAQLRAGRRVLAALWQRHQGFRGLLLREREGAGRWWALAIDVVAPEGGSREWLTQCEERSEACAREAKALVATRTRDLGGAALHCVLRGNAMSTFIRVVIEGITIRLAGSEYLKRRELETRLHLQIYANGKRDIGTNVEGLHSEELYTSGSGYIRDVAFNRVDFTVMWFHRENYQLLFCDFVPSSQLVSKLLVVVPSSSNLPAWSLPLRVFSPRIWLALLGAAVAYALAWRVVAGESLAASAAAALRAFSSCGGAPQDRVRATPQRLQLAAALLASAVVVAAAYQGRLFDLIMVPQRYPDIKTIDQLIASGMTVLSLIDYQPTIEKMKLFCSQTNDSVCTEGTIKYFVNSNVKYYNNSRDQQLYLAENRYAAHSTDRQWSLLLSTNRGKIASMKFFDVAAPKWEYMITKWNWPWVDPINLKLIQFRDAGLDLKWADDFNRTWGMYWRLYNGASRGTGEVVSEAESDEPRTLELQDLRPHLALLCAGLALAAAAFCAEFARSRWSAARAQMRRCLRALLRTFVQLPRPKLPLGARRNAN